MEIPNLLKGSLYPSSRVSRCPRFHSCQVTKKCQNYDRHQLDCNVCESRVWPPPSELGGMLAEGEFLPDIQDAINIIEAAINKPMAHPDYDSQTISGSEITSKYEKERKAADMLAAFTQKGDITIEEFATQAFYNPEMKKLLGRIE